jgi:type II secretory pathway pseudopilin PulG
MKHFFPTFKGFTLVETLVAILALSFSLGALTLVASRTIRVTRQAEQRVTAEFLAVEAIELAQKSVYTHLLAGDLDPFFDLRPCITQQCVVDFNSWRGDELRVSAGVDTGLYQDPTTGIYSLTASSTKSQYTRSLSVTQIGVAGMLIRSTVNYGSATAGDSGKVVLVKQISNWYK